MSLQALKQRSQNSNVNLENLAKELDNKGFEKDSRFWELTVDGKQNGEAIIRFLPGIEGEEDMPIVAIKSYYIRNRAGKFFFAEQPKIPNHKDFCQEAASKIWRKYQKTSDETYKNLFKSRVGGDKYICNILVIKDAGNPENNGKVFLFKFGSQIKKLLFKEMGIKDEKAKNEPKSSILIEEEQKAPYDPMDFWTGANFHFRSTSESGLAFNRNYESSKFLKQAPVAPTDEEIEAIYKQEYSLKEFRNPDSFPSYEELKERYIENTDDYYEIFPEEQQSQPVQRPVTADKFETDNQPWNKPADDNDAVPADSTYDDDVPF